MIEAPVEQALRLDASCLCVNLFQISGEPEIGQQCVENILSIRRESERCSMPVMVEPLVFQPNERSGGYAVDGDPDKIVPLVRQAVEMGIPVPAMSSALAFYDGYRHERLPANLLQAQRDYFGAHTYERIDRPRGEFFHTNWTGRGGDVTSGSYQA